MKKGTIFKNDFAGYESYFIFQNSVKSGKHEMPKVGGYGLYNLDGKWILRKCLYYAHSLKDSKYYPVVGVIDIDELIKNGILQEIDKWKDQTK